LFTGNCIAPKGDLASRSLQINLEVDRPDPENREFAHPDPIAWTLANRGKILTALYVVMMGNPGLGARRNAAETRFKDWWRLVGSAVENAAVQHLRPPAKVDETCPPKVFAFKDLFLEQEQEDAEGASLGEFLSALHVLFGERGFGAAELLEVVRPSGGFWGEEKPKDRSTVTEAEQKAADAARDVRNAAVEMIREFLTRDRKATPSAKSIGKLLASNVGNPVRTVVGTGPEMMQAIVSLQAHSETHKNAKEYWLRVKG
jgi:hypothetical protein